MRVVIRVLPVIALLLLGPAPGGGLQAQTAGVNVLLIVADDLGYGDIGVHGSRDIPTPHIDSIAANGIRFTDGYAGAPLGSPARAALMTGRYSQRFGHEFNLGLQFRQFGLPVTEKTLADRLKQAGYRTALLGKWHLGFEDQFHPLSRGFEEFFGFLGPTHSFLEVAPPGQEPILDGRTPVRSIGYLTETLADRAVAYIKKEDARPFFLMLSFNAVHTPLQWMDGHLERFKTIADQGRRRYAAVLSAMDDAIGRVLATLREQKLEEKTLVIFVGDNGGPTMAGTPINGSSNAPLRGSKRQTYEGGIRVPFLAQWKGTLSAGARETRPVSQLDILPTVLAVAGVHVENEWKIDGVNLLPYLTGKASGDPHDALYWRLGGTMAVRRGNWKLVKTAEGRLAAVADPGALDDLWGAELFNLADDIGEQKNVASANLAKVKELANLWQQWNKQLAKPSWAPGPRITSDPVEENAPPTERKIVSVAADRLPRLGKPGSAAGSWPSFRGPGAFGVSEPQNLPDKWDGHTRENILWRTQIPGLAHSSPVVWGDRIFVTTAISSRGDASFRPGLYGAGTASEDQSPHKWMVYAMDKRTGKIVWERVAHEGVPRQKRHIKSTYASATPATDGRIVVASFGSEGVYAYDLDGRFRWKVDVGRLDVGAYNAPDVEWGTASSPTIWNDLVILQCDNQTDSFVLAVDASTGKTVWKTDRDELPSWGTPTVVDARSGPVLVSNASNFIRGYDPNTGKELWRLGNSSKITAPTPFLADGLVVVASGRAPERPIFVLRPDARGDITLALGQTSSDAVVWSRTGRGSYMPTPLAYRGLLYVLANNGLFDAYELKTGKEVYRQRLPHLGSGFSASPVAADGKIYISGEDGEMMVVAAGVEFKAIATNSMGELLMATPALSEGVMYVRGVSSIFAIGRKK